MKISSNAGNTMRYLTFLILVFSTSLNASAIHKWVDENGNVHYGDAPPVKTQSENVRVQSAPSNPGKALPRLSTPDATKSAAGGDTGGSNSNTKASKEQAAKNCEIARQDMQVITTNSRIMLQQSDGSSRYLTDTEIEQRKAQSQTAIDQYCN